MFCQGFGLKAGMGDIAATAARDLDLAKRMGCFFKDQHSCSRCCFSTGDCGKKAGGTTADDHQIPVVLIRHLLLAQTRPSLRTRSGQLRNRVSVNPDRVLRLRC